MIFKPVLSYYIHGDLKSLYGHVFKVNITAVFNYCAY